MQIEVNLDYKPNPKQGAFHGMKAKYRGFCGGWGNGKTTAGCVETFLRLMEYPQTECIIARKTRPELRATTWKMFMHGDTSPNGWHGIPKETIKVYNRSDLYLELVNGSVVHGVPLDDPAKLENYNLGLFWVDQAEEIEEDIFLKFHGRLRQQGAPREGLLTFNPNGHNWLWRKFIDQDRLKVAKKTYACVEATPFDNPNLPEDYLEQFENLPKHWYERFVLGSHEVFVGQIFTDYNPDVHVISPFRLPSSWERWSCYDPGIRHEGALVWVARDPDGNCYYYREVLQSGKDVAWWASTWLEKEAEYDWGGADEEIFRRFVGPEARIRSQTDGRSVYDLLTDSGVYPELSDRDPTARISRISEYLRPLSGHLHPFRDVEPTTVGAPRLYIFADCEKIQEYLPQYRWKPQRTNFTEEDSAERPRKKDDHNIDCLGHILVALDDLPEVEARDREIRDPETRLLEEHFNAEVELAGQREAFFRAGSSILV
jgi:terminase large subunit-like protein